MSGSVNNCEFIGHIAREIEFRSMSNGTEVANFTIACTERWKDRETGEQKSKTEWVRCVSFNEFINKALKKFVHKGDLVRFVGACQTRKWVDNNGQDKYSTEFVAQKFKGELTMLGGKSDADKQKEGAQSSSSSRGQAYDMQRPHDDLDQDMPDF